ncbi:TPA: hypothetical protein ACX6RZ_001879 [Photobacterium damselae]
MSSLKKSLIDIENDLLNFFDTAKKIDFSYEKELDLGSDHNNNSLYLSRIVSKIKNIFNRYNTKRNTYNVYQELTFVIQLENHFIDVYEWDSQFKNEYPNVYFSKYHEIKFIELKGISETIINDLNSYSTDLSKRCIIRLINDGEKNLNHINNVNESLSNKIDNQSIENIKIASLNKEKLDEEMLFLIDNFSKKIESELKSTKNHMDIINEEFNKSSESIRTELFESVSLFNETLKEKTSHLKKEIDKIEDKLHIEIKKEVKEFANQKNKLTSILGSLSEFRRAKSDISHAESQKIEANNFRFFGLLSMSLPIIAFMLFFVQINNDNNIYSLVFNFPDNVSGYFLRFLTIILFSSPSIYLLKESAYHRKQELIYRNRGIQLSSIGAYLDDLPEDVRTTLKCDLVNVFYGPADGKADVSHIPDIIKQIKEVALVSKSLGNIVTEGKQGKTTFLNDKENNEIDVDKRK